MDLDDIKREAEELIEDRGGTDALTKDAKELKDIATSGGSITDKGKDALEALKDPGAKGPDLKP